MERVRPAGEKYYRVRPRFTLPLLVDGWEGKSQVGRRKVAPANAVAGRTGTTEPFAASIIRSCWLRCPPPHLSICGEDISPVPTANACWKKLGGAAHAVARLIAPGRGCAAASSSEVCRGQVRLLWPGCPQVEQVRAPSLSKTTPCQAAA